MSTEMKQATRSIPPWLWLVGGAIYVICPLDFDFIPVVGWIDDAFVAYWCVKQYFGSNAKTDVPPMSAPSLPMRPEPSRKESQGWLVRLAKAWWNFI